MKTGNTAYVLWHDGIRVGTVTAVREHDYSVPPGCVRVNLPGPALGRYNLPTDRVYSDLALAASAIGKFCTLCAKKIEHTDVEHASVASFSFVGEVA